MKVTRKFRMQIVGILTICALGICGCGSSYDFSINASPDFRNCEFGYTLAQVRSAESSFIGTEKNLAGKTMLTYSDITIDGMKASMIYTFDGNGGLESGILYYYPEDDAQGVYDALVNKCDNLYGKTHYISDATSVTWKLADKYVVVIKSEGNDNKIIYNVCTPESY